LAKLLSGETRGQRLRIPLAARAALFVAVITAFSLALLVAQAPNSVPPPPPQTEVPPSVISVQTDLILVRVVVRDTHGNAVTGLDQSDFQLFDNGKPQTIAYFAAENSAAPPVPAGTPATQPAGAPSADPSTSEAGQRYTALFFDDYHLQFEDLARTRLAAQGFVTKALSAGDRIGIFTASGQVTLDFTTDADKLQKALSELRVQGQATPLEAECPPLLPYLAQLDLDDALSPEQVAQVRAMTAACVGPAPAGMLDSIALDAAHRIIDRSDIFAQNTLTALQNLVRYIEKLPGERRIGMVSDGFQNRTHQYGMNEIINEAIRGSVVINALDAQGLTVENRKREEALDPDTGVIEDTAKGTGGIFVDDTNDYEGGLERLGGVAEASYVLGFMPDKLSFDGRYHKLRTVVAAHRFWAVQARAGYFATLPGASPAIAADADSQEQASYKAILAATDADQQILLGQDFLRNYPTSRFRESVSNHLVQAYYSEGDWTGFYAASASALAKDPDDVDVLVLTGWVVPRLYDPNDSGAAAKLNQAENNLKRAIQLIPALPKPAAFTDAQFASYKDSQMSRAHSGLGLIELRRQDYQSSVRDFELATLNIGSPDPRDLYLLGVGLLQLKRNVEATDAFEKCGQTPGEMQDRCKQLAHQVGDQK
jgi:VWFA-related protein